MVSTNENWFDFIRHKDNSPHSTATTISPSRLTPQKLSPRVAKAASTSAKRNAKAGIHPIPVPPPSRVRRSNASGFPSPPKRPPPQKLKSNSLGHGKFTPAPPARPPPTSNSHFRPPVRPPTRPAAKLPTYNFSDDDDESSDCMIWNSFSITNNEAKKFVNSILNVSVSTLKWSWILNEVIFKCWLHDFKL